MVYIDLNPVRAGMVAQPLDHPWSSHAHYVGARLDNWLVAHDVYWALGNTPFAREAAYAELVQAGPKVLAALEPVRRAEVQHEIALAFQGGFLTQSLLILTAIGLAWWIPVRRI